MLIVPSNPEYSSFLKVINIENGITITTQRRYKLVTYMGYEFDGNREIRTGIEAKKHIWGPLENNYDDDGFEITENLHGNEYYDSVFLNQTLLGQIHEFRAVLISNPDTGYQNFLCVSLEHDGSPIEQAAKELFYRGNEAYYPIDEYGNVYKVMKTIKPPLKLKIQECSNEIQTSPDSSYYFYSKLAEIYFDVNDLKSAQYNNDKAISTLPSTAHDYTVWLSNFRILKSKILCRTNKKEKALEILNTAFLPNVSINELLINKSQLLFELNKNKEAMELLDLIIRDELSNENKNYERLVGLYILRKKINESIGNLQEAEEDLEKINRYKSSDLLF